MRALYIARRRGILGRLRITFVEVLVMSMVLALLVVGLAALPAAAQDRLDAVAGEVDRAITAATEPVAVERMARFLGTSADALRAERASSRLGWGDVFISHRIATRGGHPIEKVFAARRSGAAWEQIAEEARVDADALVQDVGALWPDATRMPGRGPAPGPVAPAPAAASAEGKSLGGRVLEFLRGAPDEAAERARDDKPADRTQEEIRDRMIRGGGRSR
jgi:hypothetical protein